MTTTALPGTRYRGSALERWKIGHRHFFSQIQSIVLAIKEYRQSPCDERLKVIADVILGSAAAMQFCADFADDDYELVRESMASVDEKFSGIFSADHRMMLHELKKLRASLPERNAARCELEDAINVVYAAHAFVCRRFVGDNGSLANGAAPAWQTITSKFMKRTLRLIGAQDPISVV